MHPSGHIHQCGVLLGQKLREAIQMHFADTRIRNANCSHFIHGFSSCFVGFIDAGRNG